MTVEILFTKLDERAIPPRQAHPGEDAGWDLFALEDTWLTESTGYGPSLTWVRTGIAAALPRGFYGRIVGRSSAANRGFHVIEGVMDAGYRGEQLVRVAPLWHPDHEAMGVPGGLGHEPVIRAGASLAQLIVQPVPQVTFREVDALPDSQRGVNGFGSSGL